MVDKKIRKRSLGGVRMNPTQQAASATEELRHIDSFISRDEREIVHVSPTDIKKSFNARFVPCSLEEFSEIEWPSLSLSVEEARELYPTLLESREFWQNLGPVEREDFLNFLAGVHTTSASMVNDLQIHPITLERESTESTEFFIVDGERRSLSALYSRGKIPVVKACVYNRMLSPLQRAKLKDIANSGVPLTVYETILSKLEIYKAYEGASALNVRDFGQLLGYKKDSAAILKKLFLHAEMNHILERVRVERLGWRDIAFLLKNGADAKIPEKDSSPSPAGPKSLSDGTTKKDARRSPDIIGLEERLSQTVGYPCSIGWNEGSDKVKLTFKTSLADFESLLDSLQRLDVSKVIDS
jgi:hypothetical protein